MVGRLVRLSAGHKKIILYFMPGKEALYEGFRCRRMTAAMAIFEDPDTVLCQGLYRALARPLRRDRGLRSLCRSSRLIVFAGASSLAAPCGKTVHAGVIKLT
jgi:hypothetical protein